MIQHAFSETSNQGICMNEISKQLYVLINQYVRCVWLYDISTGARLNVHRHVRCEHEEEVVAEQQEGGRDAVSGNPLPLPPLYNLLLPPPGSMARATTKGETRIGTLSSLSEHVSLRYICLSRNRVTKRSTKISVHDTCEVLHIGVNDNNHAMSLDLSVASAV